MGLLIFRVCGVLARDPCLPIVLTPLCQEGQVEGELGGTLLGRQVAPLTLQEDPGPGPLVSGVFALWFARELGVIAPFYG